MAGVASGFARVDLEAARAFTAHMERVRGECAQLARLRRDCERFTAALEAARAWRVPTWK
jgi:hypothetical protein